jgi:hypothetical protein
MNRISAAILVIATFAVGHSSELFGCENCASVTAEDLRVFDILIMKQRTMILGANRNEKPEYTKRLRELVIFRQRLEDCTSRPLVDTDRSFLEEIVKRIEAQQLNSTNDIHIYEGLVSLLERIRQCSANRVSRTISGTCRKTACCDTKTVTRSVSSSFDITSQCGTRFHNPETVTNGTAQEVQDAGERSDMRFNAVIGSQSWGCHVRPTVVVQPNPCYTHRRPCHTYGMPAPALYNPYGGAPFPVYALSAHSMDTRNPVVAVPPGTPNPGCSCPGHRPGEPCHCGPHCRQCQGACNAR